MPHEAPLIATIVAALGLAFILGLAAQRLKLPALAGYLLAGVVIGPFTPGYVADQKLAGELAEIGIILLMFGVGLHFSLRDLISVRAIAIPGAIGQIAAATLLGMLLAWALGWGMGAGVVLGLALSVASTVVLLRALEERRLIETERGRIAVGWLIVEDLVMVLTLVLLPPLAGLLGGKSPEASSEAASMAQAIGLTGITGTIVITGVKVIAFVALMLIVGRRVVPYILHYVAHTGSRELFRLSVLAVALGVAYLSAVLFGVSFALGAFFAGMILAESPLSHQAAKETLPLRDAFAVIFFVSVGMLFNPMALLQHPIAILSTIMIIVGGKSAAAYLIVRAFGHERTVAFTISASLAQIGEFSFILAVLGVTLGVLPPIAQDLIVAGALFSILINPLVFRLLDKLVPQPEADAAAPEPATEGGRTDSPPVTSLVEHAVVVGCGRVGGRVCDALSKAGVPVVAIEENPERAQAARDRGIEVLVGSTDQQDILQAANIQKARWLLIAIPDPFESGRMIETARRINPAIRVIARAHSDAGVDHLQSLGADRIVMGESEIAAGMISDILT